MGLPHGLFASQTVCKACIGVFAVIVFIPKSDGLTTTPAAVNRCIGSAPLADTPLLVGRDVLQISLDDKLVVFCHLLVLFLGHVASLDGIAVSIDIAHIKLADANQFA